MKLRLLLIFLTVSVCSNAQTFQEGTNLQAEYSKISQPYFFEAPCYTSWIEGANLLLIGDRPDQNDCDFVFLALHDTTLIGVYKTQEPHYFIFDTEGNSILGKPTAYFQLPLWTVMKNIHIDSSDMKVLKVLDKFYEMTLQDNYLDLNAATLKNLISIKRILLWPTGTSFYSFTIICPSLDRLLKERNNLHRIFVFNL